MESTQYFRNNWPYRYSFHRNKCLSLTMTSLFVELLWRSASITSKRIMFLLRPVTLSKTVTPNI